MTWFKLIASRNEDKKLKLNNLGKKLVKKVLWQLRKITKIHQYAVTFSVKFCLWLFSYSLRSNKNNGIFFLAPRKRWELHSLLEQFVELSQLISLRMLCGTQLCMKYIADPVSSDTVYSHCSKRTKYNINSWIWYNVMCKF